MSVQEDVRDIFERRYKGRGLTLPMLQFATASAARHAGLSEAEVSERLKRAKHREPGMDRNS